MTATFILGNTSCRSVQNLLSNIRIFTHLWVTPGGTVCSGTALQAGRSRVRFPMVSLQFFIGIILPAALWPWGRLGLLTEMSARNISQWLKGGQCVGLTTCLDIWQPQPPGTPRACPGLQQGKLYILLIYGAKCTNGVKIYTMQKQFVKFFLQPFKA
jgi:hypothetical protein